MSPSSLATLPPSSKMCRAWVGVMTLHSSSPAGPCSLRDMILDTSGNVRGEAVTASGEAQGGAV